MAQPNYQQTSGGKVNNFIKGMNKDTTDIFMAEGLYYNAINAINNSHYGESGSIGNEPSNLYCTTAPFTIIGYAFIRATEWVVFSTNNITSEIGIFDETGCKYTRVIRDECLNLKTTNLITAFVKENYDCTFSVYWQDNLNPDRVMNLNNVPYICEPVSEDPCDGEVCTDRLDCDKIRLHPIIKQPCIDIQKARGAGQLNNGSYMAVIAYSENNIRLTDYSMPSTPQGLWYDTGIGGSLEINLSDLDEEYDEYELVIIGVVAQQAIAKKIGYYNIKQTRVVIDLIQGSLETVPLSYIPLRSVVYEKSEKMAAINGYLIRSGVTTKPYFNYQPQANQIKANWVAAEYDVNYYWNGGNITGYMRDEVYSFFIRWIYNTGNRSASFHIPGRAAIASDLAPVSGPDVVYPNETQAWQVYDTATIYSSSGTTKDNGVIIARGDMAYWESSERYPAEPEVWGDLCFKQIRHHKMPSNETIHIHNQTGGRIIILGVEFSNITHPLDSDGNPIRDIVGYEILRGSREGNKSIVAKGLFGNMLEYNIDGGTPAKKGLIQNYPYNDVRPDPFLSDDYTILDNNVNESDTEAASQLENYKQNYLSFHSVENDFVRPAYGRNYIKVYTEEKGIAFGQFELPYKHPRFKLLTDNALTLAFLVGAGIGLMDSLGKTTVKGGQFPLAAGSGSPYGDSSRESGPSTTISDLISGGILSASSGFGSGNVVGIIFGVAQFLLSFTFWVSRGMGVVLDLIRSLTNYRDYALQYNSHGFFSSYAAISNSSMPSSYPKAFRRRAEDNGIKYIGMHLQDLDNAYRVNNLYRTKFVCVKLASNLPFPVSIDNSKKNLQRLKDEGLSNIHKNPFIELQSSICQYYGAIKLDYENQYGQLSSIVQIPVNSCVFETQPIVGVTFSTNQIFGGDVYINRYTEKHPYYFFNSWMLGELDGTEFDYRNHVNGQAPRYWASYYNFDVSDFGITASWPSWTSGPDIDLNTPSDYYRLDANAGFTLRFVRKYSWFYLFYNGVKDYFTESELNMAFRDYGLQDDTQKFYDVYGRSFNDLSKMFRSDLIKTPIYYKYDLSLSTSKLFNNLANWGQLLPADYKPSLYESCFEYLPRRSVYSLQQKSGLRRDNWRNYLPLNYKDFNGKINIIKPLNATGAIILFENAEPVTFVGVDQLQTQGNVKVTIGDSGLFQGNYQSLVNADDALDYGSSISSRAAVNTPYGLFFVSQKIGKVFQTTGGSGLDEISRNGLKFWFAENLPSKMIEVYPDYPLYDNPVAGIGVQAIYDPMYELLYITKRDYLPLRNDLKFDDPSGVPYYLCGTTDSNDSNIQRVTNNPAYHDPQVPSTSRISSSAVTGAVTCELGASAVNITEGQSVTLTWSSTGAVVGTLAPVVGNVTASGYVLVTPTATTTYTLTMYSQEGQTSVCTITINVTPAPVKCPCAFDDPACFKPCHWTVSYDPKIKAWVSFHDWHPTLMIPSYQNFYTVKYSSIWKHNVRWDSFCNYYGDNYPWEIEYPLVTPNQVTTLRSFEYYMDVYKFYNDGKDYFHVLDENFDRVVIYNSEQISGLLKMKIKAKNDPLSIIAVPTVGPDYIEILGSKEENKYRFNQFWDITNDRGEFTGTKLPMWNTDCSGYKKLINPDYVDYNKPPLQHKKFRHYGNKVILRKNISNDNKMILKLTNVKNLNSPR